MTKLEEYLSVKNKLKELKEKWLDLKNEIYYAERAAEKTCDHLREAWLKAKEESIIHCKLQMAPKIGEYKVIEEEMHRVERKFNAMHYDCNHKDEKGVLALQFEGFMYEPEDKRPLKCFICGEIWK